MTGDEKTSSNVGTLPPVQCFTSYPKEKHNLNLIPHWGGMNIQTTNTVASVSKDREAEQRIILFTMRVLETRLIQLESCD